MDGQSLSLLVLFSASMTFSPGPANLALLGYSVQLGVKKTLPILAGILTGFMLMAVAICVGLGGIFKQYPELIMGIKVLGTLYMVYLAYQLWRAGGKAIKAPHLSPTSGFLKGIAIHPLNPKAWLMLLTAYSQFVSFETPTRDSLILIATFCICGLFANGLWTVTGTVLHQHLQNPKTRSLVFTTLAASLLLLAVALWMD